jgi:putative endonuclease
VGFDRVRTGKRITSYTFFGASAVFAESLTEKLRFSEGKYVEIARNTWGLRRAHGHFAGLNLHSVILSRAKDPRINAHMPPSRHAWIYILASRKNGTLYVGITADLRARVCQHKTGAVGGFTQQYHVKTLVYFEEFQEVRDAIAREKAIKGWTRKKIGLIESANPDWDDLAVGWVERGLGPSHGSG